ncbi:hypothetical protein IHE45_01G098000 [Dioscorea alata]|uniref:Uncharacterized protein n=1 Tax=Dioscorea alata TaxID=55571 RepID=A0ACB7WWM6_DIOAL|nr:hypothetical protein IHE45_01G098000 [Dioscorea alata]
MPRSIHRNRQRTSPLAWMVAIVCAILAIAVIITGIVISTIYVIYRPKMPRLKVAYAHLNKLDYDQSGLLDTEIMITIVAENNNTKANASFSETRFILRFHGIKIAELRADPFDVPKNSSFPLNYDVASSPIPLDQGAMEAMDNALKAGGPIAI